MPHPDSIRLVLVIASFLCLVMTLRRPFYGLLSYTIIMVTRPGLFYPILHQIRIELVIGLLVIVVILLSPKRLRLISLSDPILKYLFLFYVAVIFSTFQAFSFPTAFATFVEFTKILVYFIMIVTLIDSEPDLKTFCWVFVLLTFYLSYEPVYQYTHGILVSGTGMRVDHAVMSKGMGSGHVALANVLLQGLPFLWFLLLLQDRNLVKFGAAVMFASCVYGILISGSRGGFLGLLFMFVALILLSRTRLFLILAFISFLYLAVNSMGPKYEAYMGTILDLGDSDLSASSRLTGLRHGIEMLIRRPFLGVGPGCYPVARKAWFGWGLWSHNHFGQLMGDLGILGTFTWFCFLYMYLKRAWNIRRISDNPLLKSGIASAIVVSSFIRLLEGMFSHSLYIFFWYMSAALVVVIYRLANDHEYALSPY